MVNWKTDRRVHFAVGLAVIVVAAKWLFSGSLFYAAVDVTAKPADGQTSAGITISALLPIVFDLVIGGVIFIGGYAINLAEIVYGRVQSIITDSGGQPRAAVSIDSSQPADSVSLDSPGSLKRAADQLIDAVAVNDLESVERLRKQIRKPYALAELNEAYTRGDTETAADLVTELNKMHEEPLVVASKKKGNGGNHA